MRGIKHVVDPGFRERHFGHWEGRSWQEIQKRYPSEFARWERYEPVVIPGGETPDELEARAIKAWHQLLSHSFTCAAVVSHGAFNLVLLSHLMSEWQDGQRPRQQHGCVNEIQITNGVPRVVRMNLMVSTEEKVK